MAGQQGSVAARVEGLVRPVIEELGLRLWDVVYEKEGAEWFLKVLIERPDGPMDTDTCEKASRAIDPVLDEADPIDTAYYLEVGSPGLGRRLTRPEHFELMAGQRVRVKLYRAMPSGAKELHGQLGSWDEGGFVLETEAGELELTRKQVAGVWLADDEDLF